MKIEFTLNETHKSILVCLHLFGELRRENLESAVGLLGSTNFDYIKLLKMLVTEPSWEENYLFWSFKGSFVKLEKEINVLELLDLLSKEAIYKDVTVENEKKENVQVKKLASYKIRLTEEGKRIAEMVFEGRRVILRPVKTQRSTIFIACAFGYKEIDHLFEYELKPACEAVNYTPFRVDLNEPPQTITQLILQGIIDSECMIADLTFARPSVYFEIGVAHGLGVPLILTCREDHYRSNNDNLRVHFDLEQYKISYWSKTANEIHWPEDMEPSKRLKSIFNLKINKYKPILIKPYNA